MHRLLSVLTGVAAVTVAASAQATPPVVTFDANWSVSQSAPLVAGQPAIFRYDTSRLPSCRATYHGLPAWAIAGMFQADSSSTVPSLLVTNGSAVGDQVDVPFTVPYGADLSVWFHNSDEWGCSTWDSNFGQNYHVAIQGPPTIHFNVDWTNPVAGSLAAGANIAVDYDVRRLSTCRGTYGSSPAWSVSVEYRFDGGSVNSASLSYVPGGAQGQQTPAVIAVPAGAHQVEMWFVNNDVNGCIAYDSSFGQNYVFALP